jgi:hypothetical protein
VGVLVKTFDTPAPISVTVELLVGAVHLIAGDRSDTVVAVNPSDETRKPDVEAAAQTRVELAGGRLLVQAPRHRGLGSYLGRGGRAGSLDIVIELPAGSHVHGEAALADFRSDGRLGDVRIKTGAGEVHLDETRQLRVDTSGGGVTVNRADGPATVTGAGDLRVAAIDGHAVIKNLNGRTWVGDVAGDLRVKSANGDITVGRAFDTVVATTANGSIQIGEVARGSVVLKTGSGALEVGIREGSAAWLDVRSSFGRVRNALGAAEGPKPSQETVEVRARTAYGDITIHRA